MLESLLNSLVEEYEGDFVGYVAQDLLDTGYDNDTDLFKHMENISLFGGVSGTISSLIYHFDINNVFRNYFESILNYLNERDIVITDLSVDNLVWSCYECIVDDIIAQYEQQQEEVE